MIGLMRRFAIRPDAVADGAHAVVVAELAADAARSAGEIRRDGAEERRRGDIKEHLAAEVFAVAVDALADRGGEMVPALDGGLVGWDGDCLRRERVGFADPPDTDRAS
jgi:hypothetical protein